MSTQSKMQEVHEYAINRMIENEMNVNLIAIGWKFEFNNRFTRCIGRCSYNKKLIELSTHFLPTLKEHEWKDVINHEIAHALTPFTGHGANWKRVARILGAVPRATKRLEDAPAKKDPTHVVYFLNKNGQYEIAKHCYRRPSRSFATSYIKGRRSETEGKLKVCTYEHYKTLTSQ